MNISAVDLSPENHLLAAWAVQHISVYDCEYDLCGLPCLR
jgi:hypothetical protein